MFLPGHEPGHIALYSEADSLILSGDVLFPNGHGRVDLPDANKADMEASLRQLMELPDETVVYNGHGLPTSIGAERWWMPRVG
jgi:glyoxylase-like metal-dependent hydrolase (beta-lactamase superfamily II)